MKKSQTQSRETLPAEQAMDWETQSLDEAIESQFQSSPNPSLWRTEKMPLPLTLAQLRKPPSEPGHQAPQPPATPDQRIHKLDDRGKEYKIPMKISQSQSSYQARKEAQMKKFQSQSESQWSYQAMKESQSQSQSSDPWDQDPWGEAQSSDQAVAESKSWHEVPPEVAQRREAMEKLHKEAPEFKIPEFVMPSAETKAADIARMKNSGVHETNLPTLENKRPHPKMMPFLIPIPNTGVRRRVLNSNDEDGMIIYPVEYEINLEITWEKMVMASKTIAQTWPEAVVFACSASVRRSPALKDFAGHTLARLYDGSCDLVGKKLLVITYPTPWADHRRLMKAAYDAGIPTIAFCPYDCPMEFVDDVNTTVIPAGVKLDNSRSSVPCIFDILTRMVLQARGQMKQGPGWYKMKYTLMDMDKPLLWPAYTTPRKVDYDTDEEEEDEVPAWM